MPVPKRKVSRARRDKRSANWGIKPQIPSFCFNGICEGEPKLPHVVCTKCGFYKGKKVMTTKLDRDLKRTENKNTIVARSGSADMPKVEAPAAEATTKKEKK
jgi:large subunit ribosomal protein L32